MKLRGFGESDYRRSLCWISWLQPCRKRERETETERERFECGKEGRGENVYGVEDDDRWAMNFIPLGFLQRLKGCK